jgi:hypothetical protein
LIENPFGTGAGHREETAVRWSPSGRFVAAVETAAEPSLFVVDVEGRDLVEPRSGTFARWLSGEVLLYQKNPQDATKPWMWATVNVGTGVDRPFGLPAEASRPAISPTGRAIVFDDGDALEPSVSLFTIGSGEVRPLGRGVGAIWLDANRVAATRTGPCRGDLCSVPWVVLPETASFDIGTAEAAALSLPATLGDDLRFGPIDVWFE